MPSILPKDNEFPALPKPYFGSKHGATMEALDKGPLWLREALNDYGMDGVKAIQQEMATGLYDELSDDELYTKLWLKVCKPRLDAWQRSTYSGTAL